MCSERAHLARAHLPTFTHEQVERRRRETDLNLQLKAEALVDAEEVLEVKKRELRAANRKHKELLKDQARLERVQHILEDLDTLSISH